MAEELNEVNITTDNKGVHVSTVPIRKVRNAGFSGEYGEDSEDTVFDKPEILFDEHSIAKRLYGETEERAPIELSFGLSLLLAHRHIVKSPSYDGGDTNLKRLKRVRK